VSGRLLLIGGTGFLGSFVATRLASREPLVLVRPTSDRRVLPPRVEVRVGELSRPLPLDGVETLVYCASMGFGQVPALVQQLDSAGVRRAIFVSTTAIYTSLPAPSRDVRLQAEEAVQASSLNWTIVRPTMIYGTRRDRNISRLLRFLHRWPVFPQCGNALWQPVHVEDVADAIVSLLGTSATYRRAYNLPGAKPLRFADLVLLVPVPLAAAALGARLTRAVSEEQVRRLAEDKAFPFIEASADFSYSPRSFEEGARAEARLLGLAP
jgi:nucleoside-diphosphate-sugar epimerase